MIPLNVKTKAPLPIYTWKEVYAKAEEAQKHKDYDNPHEYTDFEVFRLEDTNWKGDKFVDFHVGFKVDGFWTWTNFPQFHYDNGEYMFVYMDDDRYRMMEICEKAGIPFGKRYRNIDDALKDYVTIVKTDRERRNTLLSRK